MSQIGPEHGVIAAALSLDATPRGPLAGLLWASPDADPVPASLSPECQAEIARRGAEVRAGTATLIDHETVRRSAREKLKR